MSRRRTALLTLLLVGSIAVAGCGDTSGVTKGKEADRADGVARDGARALAGVVDACRVQHPSYRECNESDELEVFAQFCAQRNTTNEAKCGGAHTLEGLVFGNGPGQVEVATASRDSYTIKSYSTSGVVFEISRRRGRPVQRRCTAAASSAARCPNGRW